MLKRQITKTEHAALVPAIQVEYKADTGGETFTLDATGFDDPAELRRARDREKEKATEEKTRAEGLQAKLDALGPDAAAKLKDITSLERSWNEKLTTETGKLNSKLQDRDKFINTLMVDNVAQSMATEIAGDNAAIILPHIHRRLQVEHVDGASPITRVLDANGRPSALSVEDLKKEFKEDKRFAVVVIGSKGSGGGAAGAGAGSGGQGGGGKKFQDLSEKERVEWYKRDKDGFLAASKAAQQELANSRG
jgi:hypothetical protein